MSDALINFYKIRGLEQYRDVLDNHFCAAAHHRSQFIEEKISSDRPEILRFHWDRCKSHLRKFFHIIFTYGDLKNAVPADGNPWWVHGNIFEIKGAIELAERLQNPDMIMYHFIYDVFEGWGPDIRFGRGQPHPFDIQLMRPELATELRQYMLEESKKLVASA